MSHVEVFEIAHKGHYVALAQPREHCAVGGVAGLHIRESVAAQGILGPLYPRQRGRVGQRRVAVAVGAHEVDGAHHVYRLGCVAGDIVEIAAVYIVDSPVGNVV